MNADDEKIESMLRRYRLARPPERLRRRIFEVRTERRHRISMRRWASVAAALVLALGGMILIWTQTTQPGKPRLERMTAQQVKMMITREALASQTLEVADLIAAQTGGIEYASTRYRHLTSAYAETKAARVAKSRLRGLLERSLEQ